MNWKKLLFAVAAVYVAGFILNFVIHELLLGPTYQGLAHLWRPDMENYMWMMFITSLFSSFFFVYIFAKGCENKGILEGLRFGLVIWAFLSIPVNYGQFMMYPLPYHLILTWVLADLCVLIVLGILTALIYKPLSRQ